ncbi:hypothetical protein, partial [Deinococcus pimensis]|uniref:hypothetical protein n=1 Tax=Deinococcus pimensis TaxID=309888 RepID=UPI0005EBE42C
MPDARPPVGPDDHLALDAFVLYTQAVGEGEDLAALARHAVASLGALFPDGRASFLVPEEGVWRTLASSGSNERAPLPVETDLAARHAVFREGERASATYPVVLGDAVVGVLRVESGASTSWERR